MLEAGERYVIRGGREGHNRPLLLARELAITCVLRGAVEPKYRKQISFQMPLVPFWLQKPLVLQPYDRQPSCGVSTTAGRVGRRLRLASAGRCGSGPVGRSRPVEAAGAGLRDALPPSLAGGCLPERL